MQLRVEYPGLELHHLQSVTIERDLGQPDAATVAVSDPTGSIGKAVALGDILKIFGTPPGADGKEVVLFHGELLAVEYQSQHAALLVQLRAFGLLHRLARRRLAASIPMADSPKQLSAVVEELIKDSDLKVGKVARAQLQVSRYVHLQAPLDVLGAMALEEGCALWIDDQTDSRDELCFDKVPVGASSVATFAPRPGLGGVVYAAARAEVSIVRYPSAVEVRGHNLNEQKDVLGSASPGDISSAAKAPFPIKLAKSPLLVSEADLLADGDAKTRAINLMERAAAQAAAAEVQLDGLPPKAVGLGQLVTLKLQHGGGDKAGEPGDDPMSGAYFVRGIKVHQRALTLSSTLKLSRHVVPK